VSNGSEPLVNARHETYSQARAKGVTQADAWKAAIPFGQEYKGGNSSLRVSGHRTEQRPEVQARIDWLRQQPGKRACVESGPLTRSEIVSVSLEVAEVLETAYRASLGSAVSPQAIERLKSCLGSHLSRQGKMEDANDMVSDFDETVVEIIMASISNLKVCTCTSPELIECPTH